jgi:hypothetical protein
VTYAARLHATCTGREADSGTCRCCCYACLHHCGPGHDPDHANCSQPSRLWWSAGWDSPWWKPLILVGVRGGDEWCNRTVGLRLLGGAVFLALNIPLRRETCDDCLAISLPDAGCSVPAGETVPNNWETT